jgi:hypothetical protein
MLPVFFTVRPCPCCDAQLSTGISNRLLLLLLLTRKLSTSLDFLFWLKYLSDPVAALLCLRLHAGSTSELIISCCKHKQHCCLIMAMQHPSMLLESVLVVQFTCHRSHGVLSGHATLLQCKNDAAK